MKSPPIALPEPVPVGERYLLLRRLARGGVADIFLARQSATAGFEKEIVIKRLRPELRGNARVVKMFLEEARIGALLNHPNVVHVYDVDVHDGAPYIAMEYIVGGELGALCRRGLAQWAPRGDAGVTGTGGAGGAESRFLPFPHAVELMRQAAAGMGYLHAKRGADGQELGIVHRDVSPSNLLITEDGFLKIIDFGIAKTRRSDGHAERALPGKLSYMAPEQVARQVVDHRADIFSLGVVLYEVTLGRRLFKGPAQEVVKRISGYQIEPPTFVRRNYPAALEAIVMRALAREPRDRYQSAYDLADDLEQFLHDAKLASGPVRIARYLDELAHAEGGPRRPELLTSGRPGSESGDSELFSSFRAAPGREWDDAEEPMADVASALGIDVAELRAMRLPASELDGEGQPVRARRVTGESRPPARSEAPVNGAHVLALVMGGKEPPAGEGPGGSKADAESKAGEGAASGQKPGAGQLAGEEPEGKPAEAAGLVEVGTPARTAKLVEPATAATAAKATTQARPSPREKDSMAVPASAGAAAHSVPGAAAGGRAEFGAALLHRAPPPHQRWIVIGISVAVVAFLIYLLAS